MQERTNSFKEDKLNSLNYRLEIENLLAEKLRIPSIRAGHIIIRDEQRWRINEKEIEYCWLVNISRSFVGWCWLFSIKYKESKFREILNPQELIQGVFHYDNENIMDLYLENRNSAFQDEIKNIEKLDFFHINEGLTFDGTSYEYIVYTQNGETRCTLNNPNFENWQLWENSVWKLGKELSSKSGSKYLIEIFT